MNISKWLIMLVVMLALTGFVLADTGNSTSDDNAVQAQALSVRYDHLQCKVDFTNAQIDLLSKYIGVNQTANKDTLLADMTNLKVYMNSSDKDGFDNYTVTFRTDLQKATQDLNAVKSNFRQYNATNDTRTAFISDFKTAKQAYDQCVGDKEIKMAGVMERHLNNQENNWGNVINNMKNKNMTTADLEALKAELINRTQELQAMIDSGNVSTIGDFMKQLNQDQLHFAARFEIGRLNGYKEKLNGLASEYNMTGQLDDIDAQIADAEQYTQPGHQYNQGEFNKVWQDIKNAGRNMQDTAKQINDERVQQRMEQRNETIQQRMQLRNETIQQREQNIKEREQRRAGNLSDNENNTAGNEGGQ